MKLVHRNVILLFVFLLGIVGKISATHNRAGEITYRHVEGYTYEITITTCTKASSEADRPWLKLRWGDEPSDVTTAELDSLARVAEDPVSGLDAKVNKYIGYHTYAGPGIFVLSVEDPNRNSGVINMVASVQTAFCITSTLVISPDTGHNNSVILTKPAKEQICIYQPWIHNPGAYDPDGDSLVYSLVNCLGNDCLPIPSWVLPNMSTFFDPNDTFTIDPQTGDVNWIVPSIAGEFNIAILVSEYRNGVFVGSVLRDMQIDVITCANQPPVIQELPDFCVEAEGDPLEITLFYTDPNNNDVDITVYGGPMTEVANTAEWNWFSNTFTWEPQCEEVRAQPYTVVFEALDNGNVPLADLETVQITVVAPRVENPSATPLGNTVQLEWDVTPCADIFTAFTGAQVRYKIYRRNDLFNFDPSECELGVPAYTGYEYIGETIGLNSNQFLDTDVYYGGTYCYMVVSCFPDGALSYASEEFCATIQKDIAVLTKSSVGITHVSTGVDTIWWSPPTDLDVAIFTGPYQYKLYHIAAFSGPGELIYESSISNELIWGDTTFIHENINTQATPHAYYVDFYSGDDLIGSSSQGSTPFVQLTPNDNSMGIEVLFDVPWQNVGYHIYRLDPGALEFVEIAVVDQPIYTDLGLQNNELYCYKVFVEGTYNAQGVPDPIQNWSQEACAQPYDRTPPCAPELTIVSVCESEYNELYWNNPNNSCADDVQGYNLYYTPVLGGTYELIATFDNPSDTSYIYNDNGELNSIAGCYVVTALDSLNLWPDGEFYQNESAFSNAVCVDNCPEYELPNIFTPNGDGLNDQFVPFEYRHIESIDLKVFNRWGIQVFETTDPDINWDGRDQTTDELCTDGVYFYTIQINTIRLTGIVGINLSGNLQLHDRNPSTQQE